eukprot:3110196-Prymnesium_polylepis.1
MLPRCASRIVWPRSVLMAAWDALPPPQDAELAYQSLLNEVDKYSRIVVGDYRTVTYKAF